MSVATISLFDTVTDSQDVAVPNATVTLTFGYNAATTADGLLAPSVRQVQTDSTGKFTFSKVIPNDLISPNNTVYLIDTPFRTYEVAPQSGNGASQQSTAANVIVNNPLGLAPYTGLSSLTVSGPVTITGLLTAASAAITGALSAAITTISGLLTAAAGLVVSGGTGATLNASGDLAVRSVTASSGSGPYVPTAPAGGIVATSLAVSRVDASLYDLGGAVVNAGASKYGLVNDAGATDQTTKLAAAIADVPTGGTLRLPPFTVKFSTLVITRAMTIEGSGWQNVANAAFGGSWLTAYFSGSVLISTATSGNALDLGGASIGVRDFMIVGPGSGTSTGIKMGTASVTPFVDVKSDNVMVANFSRGWRLEWVEECTFVHCMTRGCSTGWSLSNATNQNAWVNTEIEFSSVKAFDIDGATGVGENEFWGGLIQNASAGYGVAETGASAYCNRFVGFWVENCSGGFNAYDINGFATVLDGWILDATAMVAFVRGTRCRIANEQPTPSGVLTIAATAVNTIIDNSPHNAQITDLGTGTISINSGGAAAGIWNVGTAGGSNQGSLALSAAGTERLRLDTSALDIRAFGYSFATDTGIFRARGAVDAVLRAGPGSDVVRLQASGGADSFVATGGRSDVTGQLTVGGDFGAGIASKLSLTNVVGIGNGAATNMQSPIKGTGGGPTSAVLVTDWIKIYDGTVTRWIPAFT